LDDEESIDWFVLNLKKNVFGSVGPEYWPEELSNII